MVNKDTVVVSAKCWVKLWLSTIWSTRVSRGMKSISFPFVIFSALYPYFKKGKKEKK
jgi:hypothetical protein